VRTIMSVSPGTLLKLPKPPSCHSKPTVPDAAALVVLLLLIK